MSSIFAPFSHNLLTISSCPFLVANKKNPDILIIFYLRRGVIKKKFPTRCHPRWVRIPEKNLQKSKKINSLEPKIRLKNYPGGGY